MLGGLKAELIWMLGRLGVELILSAGRIGSGAACGETAANRNYFQWQTTANEQTVIVFIIVRMPHVGTVITIARIVTNTILFNTKQ